MTVVSTQAGNVDAFEVQGGNVVPIAHEVLDGQLQRNHEFFIALRFANVHDCGVSVVRNFLGRLFRQIVVRYGGFATDLLEYEGHTGVVAWR